MTRLTLCRMAFRERVSIDSLRPICHLVLEGGAGKGMEEATSSLLQLVKVTRKLHLPSLVACGRILRGEAAVIVGITAVVYGIGSIIVHMVHKSRQSAYVTSDVDSARRTQVTNV
ncbi:hypothetical protein LSAT2_020692 [Lamellibrachia satsuma]|nr:hypothetical protein LSAT2_020692 [Lamellibrachia satsuma]